MWNDSNEYSLGEVIYVGAETQVIRAQHRSTGKRVVIKISVADVPSMHVVGRLLHEYSILERLAAVPGVARAHAVEQLRGRTALVLEDPGLRSLERVLAERGKLPLDAALRVALALARVLEGVHAAGVMHKDIKPQNVLVDDTCTQVVLLDFGIASWLAQEATVASVPEALEGTLAYISPEQTGRTARVLDARTDLYSLGVTLFELLAGQRPFVERDPLALVHAHLARPPRALEIFTPDIPTIVSRVVARCLEKHPETRYQTARGLAADLAGCLKQLSELGQIDVFTLGQRDFSPTLRLPEELVSRERESRELSAALERAAEGAVEVLLLAGPSGVGKTTLVRSVYREIARAGGGLLLSGKHDQLGRAVPYAALARAFSGLMRDLAASPVAVFDAWRARIERALGPLARIIADLVPELEWLTGPLPPVPVVSTEMTFNRLKLSWIEFVRVVTEASPPLVLFLDDLQWVDLASLELLKTLLTDPDRKHLLVIAAYRDNEVDPAHPLWKFLGEVEESGVKVPRLTLGPLDEASVQVWLAAALSAEPRGVATLATALSHKTHGNPFFLGQLLLELYRQKRVRRDPNTGAWEWDQDAVERAAVTDNVVELMQRKVVELPAATQSLLGQAACAGHSFSLAELAVLAGLSHAQAVQDLRPALQAGLVIPQDGQYRAAEALVRIAERVEVDAGYRFLHDRVQQGFYERIATDRRARTHLVIGRRLQAAFEGKGGSDQQLLEIARHLNLGAGALDSDTERKALAQLDLQAARAAKAHGSYQLQAALVEQAQGLLGAHAMRDEPSLAVELVLERIEADYMLRAFDEVHRRALDLLERPLPAVARLTAQNLRMRAFVATGNYGAGERLGIAALAEQGITYPETSEECLALVVQGIQTCDAWLDQHPEGFSGMPMDPSREHLLCDALEASMAVCVGLGSGPVLAVLAVTRNVQQAMERRMLSPTTPFFISSHAMGRSAFFADYRGDVRWTLEGKDAATRLDSSVLSECAFYQGLYVPHVLPAERCREHFHAGLRAATASGSFQGTSWALLGELCNLELWSGRPLGHVAQMEEVKRNTMARAGDAFGQHIFALVASYSAFLRAPESIASTPGAERLTASSRYFLALGDGLVAEIARIMEAHLFLGFGEYTLAFERADEAERFRPTICGYPWATDIPLWHGLAAAKCWSSALVEDQRVGLVATLERCIERFHYFSEGCAENFLHKLRLLEAERARISGRVDEAMVKYDEALTLARNDGFLHIEALAAQLCAEFHLAAGRERIGALYLREARDGYLRWDALALAAHLEAKYPHLLPAEEAHVRPVTSTMTTATTDGVTLDVDTAIRAAQALSSELDPERVVGRLMALCLENAGAQTGALILREGEALSVVSRLSVAHARIEIGFSEPLAASSDVAVGVVQYVARTGESVVIGDARAETRFSDDPYLSAHRVLSLLALPLTHRGRLIGVLSLEHRETPAAFTPAHVQLLSVLAAQAAIAVENAMLYRDLETKVEKRTAELHLAKKEADRANQAKSDFLSSMSHELRSPLNGILGYAQILGRAPEMSQKSREGVEVIKRSGEHLLTLINDVLDLAKIEAGKLELAPRDFPFAAFLRTVTNLSKVRAEQKQIAFVQELRGPPLGFVHADEKCLTQVLLNLLSNAIKFTHRGRVTLRVDVLGVNSDSTRDVRFEIEDTGPGIDPQHLQQIFEPFEQVGDQQAKSEGTGLGLAITRRLIEQMGGTIAVRSELGRGSVFTVLLQLGEARGEVNASTFSHRNTVTGYQGVRRTILIVDDHPTNRAVARDLLTPLGFDTSEAESGEAALRAVQEHPPALILMDLAMPGLDGCATTRRLRKRPELRDVVIVACSANPSKERIAESIQAGCDDFLAKPIVASVLLELLERHLGLNWLRPANEAPYPAVDATVELPALDALKALIELAEEGQLDAFVARIEQLERGDARLGPWLRQVGALAQSFELEALCARLHADAAAVTRG